MLGEKIKSLRFSLKLNQSELAEKLCVSKQAVSNWENNNIQPSIDTLVKLSSFFGVTTDYLLGVEREKQALDIQNLTEEEIAHVQLIIDDIRKFRRL